MTSRRNFLRGTAAASGAILLSQHSALAQAAERFMDEARTNRVAPMNILIFGGTGYIGPHLVNLAVARGHKVTIFSRGRRHADLPATIERLVGDRAVTDSTQGNLTALEGRRFDAIIDDPATDPRWVRQSTSLLKDSGSYMFVSSTGVYLPYLTPNNAETDPVITVMPNPARPEYGVQKAQSEQVVREAFGEDRGQVVRPGYICGPGDTTDRFSYWPQRFAQGGEILVPGKKTDRSQLIDVRDLTHFMLKLVEERRGGTYNCTGPAQPMGFETFINEAHKALQPDAKLVWVDDYEFLRANRISYAIPWMIPEGNNAYHLGINNRKAVAAGLTFRSIAATVRDTLEDWPNRLAKLQAGQRPNFAWMNPQKEATVLAAWKARGG
jgi:2'-hydroxyisoflavone reductase